MTAIEPVTILTLASAVLVGVTLALLGTLKVALADNANLGGRRLTRYLSLLNLAVAPAVFVAGVVVDQFGVRPVLIVGSVLLALGLAAFGAGRSLANRVTGVLAGGLGAAAISTACVVLFPRALFGDHQLLASMTMGMVFVGLGALLTPVLTSLLYRGLGLRRTLALWAVVALAPAFLALLPSSKSLDPHAVSPHLSDLLAEPAIWVAGLVFLFYAPLEGAISLWVQTHLHDQEPAGRGARWHLIFFWAGFLGTRLLFALSAQAGYPDDRWAEWFLVLPALFVPFLLGTLSGQISRGRAATEMLTLGALLGPIVPVLLALVFHLVNVPGAEGAAYGIVVAVASLGGAVLNPLVAFGVERPQPLRSVVVPIVLALGLTASALAFSVMR